MRRLLVTTVTCAALLVGAAWFADGRWGAGARLLGAETLAFRREMLGAVDTPPRGGAVVAWLGDSTIKSTEAIRAYPLLIQDRAPGIASWLVASMGLDPFGFWALAEPVLEARPRAVVLIAHLRLWNGAAARAPQDVLDQVPPREMLHAAAILPLEARGITRLRLALAPAVERPVIANTRMLLDGLQRGYHGMWPWVRMPANEPVAIGAWRFLDGIHRGLVAYDVPVRARTPALVMLTATVERFTRAGVPVLVVVTPMPVEAMRDLGRYDPGRFHRRIETIRTGVERAGGRLLDLHDFLSDGEMRDTMGHANAVGQARLATRLQPSIERLVTGGGS